MDQQLVKMGFGKANDAVRRRLIMSIEGLEKSGKTHLALTAPGPIALFDFDTGLEGVVGKFTPTKEIYVKDYVGASEAGRGDYAQVWEKCRLEFKTLLKHPPLRSVVVDTDTERWELLRMARFGKLDQIMPQFYGPVNSEYRGLVRDAYASDKNVILLHKMKTVWVKNTRTDDVERSGFGEMGYLVQINVRTWRDDDGVFHAYIKDCRQNPNVAGMDLTGEMCDFNVISDLIFG